MSHVGTLQLPLRAASCDEKPRMERIDATRRTADGAAAVCAKGFASGCVWRDRSAHTSARALSCLTPASSGRSWSNALRYLRKAAIGKLPGLRFRNGCITGEGKESPGRRTGGAYLRSQYTFTAIRRDFLQNSTMVSPAHGTDSVAR